MSFVLGISCCNRLSRIQKKKRIIFQPPRRYSLINTTVQLITTGKCVKDERFSCYNYCSLVECNFPSKISCRKNKSRCRKWSRRDTTAMHRSWCAKSGEWPGPLNPNCFFRVKHWNLTRRCKLAIKFACLRFFVRSFFSKISIFVVFFSSPFFVQFSSFQFFWVGWSIVFLPPLLTFKWMLASWRDSIKKCDKRFF